VTKGHEVSAGMISTETEKLYIWLEIYDFTMEPYSIWNLP
jgi:hypothetical protein